MAIRKDESISSSGSGSDSGSDSDPDSGSSPTTKEDAMDNKKRLTPSPSDSQEQGLEVPENLYNFIQEALALEKQLETNKNNVDLISKMTSVMDKMDFVSSYYKLTGDLPKDWKYNPDTAGTCVLKKFEKKKKKKKTEKGPPNPYIGYQPLDTLEQKTWLKFKKFDEKAEITPLRGRSSKNFQRDLNPVEEDDALYSLIGDFAVVGFNYSYQMYVNKDSDKNLSEAKFMECKYHKFKRSYLFYMTIEAIEQGNFGVYEATVEFGSEDGARTLDSFVLTDREPSGIREGAKFSRESTYETVQDGLTAPEDYYEHSGMVPRSDKGGCGYDYARPLGWNMWCLR